MVRITLRQAMYFVAVADHGTMSGAALTLNISEPALADGLRKLEQITNLVLLERLPARGARLTQAGLALESSIRQLLITAQKTEEIAAKIACNTQTILRIGCFINLTPYILYDLQKYLMNRFPEIKLDFHENNHKNLVKSLANNDLDLLIAYDMGRIGEKIQTETLFSLQPYVIMREDHPLAKCKNLTLEDISNEPLALFNLPGSDEYFENLFYKIKKNPSINFRAHTMESLYCAVAAGMGIAIVALRRKNNDSFCNKVVEIPISEPTNPLNIIIARKQTRGSAPPDYIFRNISSFIREKSRNFGYVKPQ
ncbi:LysR family transcriptional regulator [Acetobacter senegalensis]|nr:LysR family transcriptional regulator [Acetobacter senegalensis]